MPMSTAPPAAGDPTAAATAPIRCVLIANRGEIARRVMRTCRDLGIATVAVFSDADATEPHVTEADVAVRLPGVAPADTYLRVDLLLDAARRAGADAVHPGYGFLSEQAPFARAVIDAGLVWIGPSPEAIEAMGSKVEAKRRMAAVGVPVLAALEPDDVCADDLPLLIKASAGGGGRGMRVVHDLDALPGELAAARAEAAAAFGDATVFCEPYLPRGHHVEVQVLADQHGTVWVLGERECSIQRRHQKVVEESPSPLVERVDGLRARLFDAARRAVEAISYTGAGTVEFLVGDDGRIAFLEVNTRLQVEHPVTEAVTGVDLVALQLHVAEGRALPEEPPRPTGHAIEVRLYAEDPAADWQPQSGTVHCFAVPGVTAQFACGNDPIGLRLDSAIAAGSVVGIHYDAMLAKVIAWAPERVDAARRLATAVATMTLHGPVTNRDLLVRILRDPGFLSGQTDTTFLDPAGLAALAEPLAGSDTVRLSALAAALADSAAQRADAPVLGGLPNGWRNVVSQPQERTFRHHDEDLTVTYRHSRDGLVADEGVSVRLVDATPERVVLDIDGVRRAFQVGSHPPTVFVDSSLGPVRLALVDRFADPSDAALPGSLVAPMPGVVVQLAVAPGDHVQQGQPLLWLEAMKMQHRIDAPAAGVVTEVAVHEGQQVDLGTVLVVVASTEEGNEP